MLELGERRQSRRCASLELIATIIASPFILFLLLYAVLGAIPSNFANPDVFWHPVEGSKSIERRQAIVDAFNFAWDGYFELAFPHDELKPLSETPGTSRNDWGATAVDAFGTAILMEQAAVVETIMDHIGKIDFHKTETDISVFETTIRYMGGILSGYDLLTGPFSHLVKNETAVKNLLVKAEEVGEMLSAAFLEGQILPHGRLGPNGLGGKGETNSIAGAGTLVLEWTRLSDMRKNPKYEQLSRAAEERLLDPEPKTNEPFPGLIGSHARVTDGVFVDGTGGWSGSADSFYEYLIKMFLYDRKAFEHYKDRWVLAADSTIRYLASSPVGFPDLTFIGTFKKRRLIPESGHLVCFAGGNFLLGGQLLKNQTYTDFGLSLVNSCHHTYETSPTRIGPETWRWYPSQCDNPNDEGSASWECSQPFASLQKYEKDRTGFWTTDPSYNLRPETLESYYYAYRMTRDTKYQDWAWDAFLAINETARAPHGFTMLRSVHDRDRQGDNQESYFFSETLKYLWLIFDEEMDGREYHVNAGFKGDDKWVFNTEGHPLKIRS